MELDPVRPCRAPDEIERLVELEAVSLGQDSFRLLDRDPRLEGLLELGPPLVRRLRYSKEPPHGGCGLLGGAGAEGVDRSLLGVLAHAG